MWNLIKSVFRSLKNNKVSVIGLTFLVFLSMGVFTVLNSTANNIKNEYNQIATSGNLHDFTVSENYNVGNIKWTYNETGEYGGYSSDATGVPNIPWPSQSGTDGSYTRTYGMTLDIPDPATDNTLIGQFYYNHGTNPSDPYYSLLNPAYTLTDCTSALAYLNNTAGDHKTNNSFYEVMDQIGDSGDSPKLQRLESADAQNILNIVTQTDTPIQNYLDDVLGQDIVTYRNFKSLDISNSPDGYLYKMVQSNPEDQIDKVYSLDENKLNNFSTFSFNPLQGISWPTQGWNFYEDLFGQGREYTSIQDFFNNYHLPDTYPTPEGLITLEQEKLHAYFLLIKHGDTAGMLEDGALMGLIDALSNPSADASWASDYGDYAGTYSKSCALISHGYKYVMNWAVGAGSVWSLEDWTSKFIVVAPEFLNKHGITPWNLESPDGTSLSPTEFISSLNAMNDADRNEWIKNLASENLNHSIHLGGDQGMPFIVIGSGITADFIYPILNLQHATPNPKSECIIFGNSNAYNRVFDSYRGNPTENYLVGKFGDGVDKQNTLDQINNEATDVMSWPKGIQAAYMANDTTDFLNASAFRIAYIPSLVNKVQFISLLLTSLIILLGLFICGIVIRRYISNNRMQIGVMRANGIKKSSIVFSLTPFALLPAIIGGIGGYVIGLLLQSPALGLFSNYWMLPTAFVSFNLLYFLIALFLPFAIFMIVAVISTLIILREKTVNLMKQGSEYKTNSIARNIKKPFVNFGILTKFRVSLAFNSIWKLIVLAIMSALAMSTLVFAVTIVGKFDYVKDKTFSSRNYSYAIDLMSPTNQGGQYIPVDASQFGESGFIGTADGLNWMPNNYFDEYFAPGASTPAPFPDSTYGSIFPEAPTGNEYYGIPKIYHSETYSLYDVLHLLDRGGLERSMSLDTSTLQDPSQGKVYGTGLYPMLSDQLGESNDLLFMKNLSMVESAMNFTVGIPGVMASNPWLLAATLMPENNKNLCDGRTLQIVQQLGEAVMGGGDVSRNPHGYVTADWYDVYVGDDFFTEVDTVAQNVARIDPACEYNYSFNSDNCVDSMVGEALTPDFISFINTAYSSFPMHDADPILANNDYTVAYNKVPLNSGDETYTYLSATGSDKNKSYPSNLVAPSGTRIVGIKPDTTHVSLVNNNGKDLLNDGEDLLADDKITFEDQSTYPIIANEFAAHKYNLKVGSKISFHIDNKADLDQNIINDEDYSPENDDKALVTFTVVGINTTYEGEEYFTNQQLANALLGLKSDLPGAISTLHNYYYDSREINDLTGDGAGEPPGWVNPGDPTRDRAIDYIYDLNNLESAAAATPSTEGLSLWNPAYDYIKNQQEPNGNITPYGFNGVFTDRTNGSAILNGGMFLYSKSGIYPGNDALNSDVVKKTLAIGPNLEVATVIAGFYNPLDPDHSTELGRQINDLYTAWVGSTGGDTLTAHAALVDKIDAFINLLTKVYGQTSFNALVNGAIDRDSTEVIFNNLSMTVEEIQDITLAIISLMVTIIVVLITIMLMNDAKKLAAILKALGYTDGENATSFLSIYAPVIILGLILAIPLSFGAVLMFQTAIFSGANVLLAANIHWWAFAIGFGVVSVVLGLSALGGYNSLKKDRLVDAIKE